MGLNAGFGTSGRSLISGATTWQQHGKTNKNFSLLVSSSNISMIQNRLQHGALNFVVPLPSMLSCVGV